MKLPVLAAAALAALLAIPPASAQTKTIKAVMHSDLTVLDPIWTSANIVRNHGYMVWDTLPTATRADRLSGGVVSPIPVFWNIEKKAN